MLQLQEFMRIGNRNIEETVLDRQLSSKVPVSCSWTLFETYDQWRRVALIADKTLVTEVTR